MYILISGKKSGRAFYGRVAGSTERIKFAPPR
jgi:hypothetical protein